MKHPKRVLDDLIDSAIASPSFLFDWDRNPDKRASHVGELIKRLSKEDREALKKLTSEDTLEYRELFK